MFVMRIYANYFKNPRLSFGPQTMLTSARNLIGRRGRLSWAGRW